jgi:iron complex outermembrane receptor protein
VSISTRLALAAIVTWAGVVPAAAQPAVPADAPQAPLTLEQLMSTEVERVFGASRFQQSVLEAPAAVSIVTRDDIERFGYRTLADILRVVRGFYTSNDRNYSYVGVAGLARPGDYNTRILLLIDGHRINDNIFDQAMIGTEFPLDVELIERVEVVRGATSSLYGTSAFFGVVNVITRRAADLGRFSGSVEAGSLGTRRIRGTFSRLFSNGVSTAISFTGFHADGERRLFYPELSGSTRTGGLAIGLDDDRFSQLFASLAAGGWKAQTVWGTRTKGIPTGAFSTAFDDDRSETTDLRGYIDASYERTWRRTALQWRGSYDRYDYDGTYALDLPDGLDPDPFLDRSRGAWWSTEATASRKVAAHHVTGGVEVRNNLRQDQSGRYAVSGEVILDDRRDSDLWSVFAQDEFRLTRRVLVNAGVRHDHYSLTSAATSPRAALIVSPRQDAALKITYGEAFRAPNAFELFYYAPGPLPLEPERIRSTEVIWEQYFARHVRVQATAFFNTVRNLISQQPGDNTTPLNEASFQNVDSTAAAGAGVEAEARLAAGVNVHGSYQFQRAHMRGSSAALSNSPRNLARAALTHRPRDGRLITSTELLVVGRRLALDGSTSGAFALWNASIAAPLLVPHVTLQLDVRNLLDRAYGDPGAEEHRQALIPQDGRTLRLRATWHF